MEHLPDAPQFQSSSWQKAQVLLRAFEGEAPAFLIAVGTAGFAGDAHVNDSVVVGAKVFMHDGHPADDPARRNPASPWSHPLLGRTLPATVPADQFATFTSLGASVEPRLLPPPISPAPQRLYVASRNYVAVGTVNVTDYDEDAASDRASLAAHASADPVGEAASLETTHGLIRVCAPDVPFLFVSGITDTVGTFGLEVTPREYAQNAAAAHNAGVAVAWLLPKIDALLAAAT